MFFKAWVIIALIIGAMNIYFCLLRFSTGDYALSAMNAAAVVLLVFSYWNWIKVREY
jgi:hypothetical protein